MRRRFVRARQPHVRIVLRTGQRGERPRDSRHSTAKSSRVSRYDSVGPRVALRAPRGAASAGRMVMKTIMGVVITTIGLVGRHAVVTFASSSGDAFVLQAFQIEDATPVWDVVAAR